MAQPTSTEWPSEPRTLIKHQIYKRYVDCWMGKILQAFPSASIVDAFAGPGRYSDGPDGSPLVLAKAFLNHAGRARLHPLRLICNESRDDRRAGLAARIAELPSDPNLLVDVRPAAEFGAAFADLDSLAHPSDDLPTLWVLDPFDIGSLPFGLVAQCLEGPRDEVLITWFADEIYRFCEKPSFGRTLDAHFGGDHWRRALSRTSEHGRKAALLSEYRAGLEGLPNLKTGDFSISSKNETARYSIVFATHSDSGLACWNPVKWGLDPAAGRAASERRAVGQDALWEERGPLRDALERRSGTAAPFNELRVEAGRLGFLDKQLRATLDEMREEGRAMREEPLDARSPWPEDCVVRFYELPATDDA